MLKIHVESIPDKEQRYNTVGDYQEGKIFGSARIVVGLSK